MGDERTEFKPEQGSGKEAPITFEKLKEDIMEVVQDLSYLIKEGLGEPGGKGILGQLSRLRETVQERRQEREGKEVEGEKAAAEEGEEPAEAKSKEGEEKPEAEEGEGGPIRLFDGKEESLEKWKAVGSGCMEFEEGDLCVEAGDDLGLVYFEQGKFDDGILRLKFLPKTPDFDASVAVRFRDPSQPVPDRENPETKYNYDNPAYVASHTGFAVQLASERPGVEPGTFEGVLFGEAEGAQLHQERGEIRTDDWNELEVEIEGNCFAVRLNGRSTSRFANVDAFRGKSSRDDPDSGFVGFLHRKGRIHLKDIEFEPREARTSEAPESRPEEEAREGSP